MKSALAQQAEQRLIELAKQLTPEQRLAAFIEHCRLMVALRLAGEKALSSTPKLRASV